MQGKAMPEPNATPVYAGFDVCKEWLDVYVHPSGQKLRVSNDRTGLKRVLASFPGARVVMEATGKFHRAAQFAACGGSGVAVVNPLRARLFAKAAGMIAKTDARMLALMGAALERAETTPQGPAPALEEVRELVQARTTATAEATALSNRLATATVGFLQTELRRRRDAEIERRILADPDMARRHAILCSIPGIGPVTAVAFIADLAELGACSAKQVAMLAGVAPVHDDSGDRSGHREIRAGRMPVRNATYMAALSASRHNPDLAAFARRLQKAGKRAKVVLVAVMRKLIVLANTLIAQNRLWSPTAP